MLRVRIPLRRCVLDTTLCDQVCQWLAAGRWFSPDTHVPSTNNSNRHDITEILLNTINNPQQVKIIKQCDKSLSHVLTMYTIKCSIAPHSSQCSTIFQMCPVFTSFSFCKFFTNSLFDFLILEVRRDWRYQMNNQNP